MLKSYATYLHDLEDYTSDAHKETGQPMDQVQCKLYNLRSLVLSDQAHLQLSAALGIVLGTQWAAVLKRCVTISELSFILLKVKLKRNLLHGNFSATTSLFRK